MPSIQKIISGGFLLFALASCGKINLYEKQVRIPSQEWYDNYTPEFTFDIEDTTASYNLYIVIRHTDMYNYNNLWLKLGMQVPGDTFSYKNINLKLASSTKWEGSGMSDIFEVRSIITPGPIRFEKQGKYVFSVAHIMRENPLGHIMNVGLRVEKVSEKE